LSQRQWLIVCESTGDVRCPGAQSVYPDSCSTGVWLIGLHDSGGDLLATARADDIQAPVVGGALVGTVDDGITAIFYILLMNMDDVLHKGFF
jgi:hypothetical protein